MIDSNNQSGSYFQNGGNGNNWNRPNQVAGCNTAQREPRPAPVDQRLLLRCAARSGQLGNASRVPVTGPDFVNTDFSVIKQFALPREMGLNFRAEFFNLFNHTQFGLPVNDVSASGFGAVNSTVNNPRLVQLASN